MFKILKYLFIYFSNYILFAIIHVTNFKWIFQIILQIVDTIYWIMYRHNFFIWGLWRWNEFCICTLSVIKEKGRKVTFCYKNLEWYPILIIIDVPDNWIFLNLPALKRLTSVTRLRNSSVLWIRFPWWRW